MKPYNEPIHEPQDDQLEHEQHVAEVDLQSAYEACRRLLDTALNSKLALRVEQLALAIQGCPTCRQMLGEKHTTPCVSFRGQAVLPADLDSRLRAQAIPADTEPF